MNSSWQIHKIGLVDFWYYDEQEFPFLDGRMLLRGSNGSGKSVTMQSFIPLLLDGNMRPERLDPFGSKARKMDNYLLEEGDGREERTGYLYMEFKREDSDTYLTIGIGMRARRAKPLDTWYFFIQDGRRIGKDFFLYRQEKDKITLTKKELRNRIGEGGKMLESQREYMSMVNKLIFGFDTIEEYKELIDLLIQLRTPKLSKDFKPTVINDILSSSLMPLSEDDLRPMSEAIENMDGLKTNLDELKISYEAARKIERYYDRYNQFLIYEKAKNYSDHQSLLTRKEKAAGQLEAAVEADGRRLSEERERKQRLEQEEQVLREEEKSLGASDASRLKEQEIQLLSELEAEKQEEQKKAQNLQEKRDRQIALEHKKKKKEEDQQLQQDHIAELLEEMEETLDVVSFDEHSFMQEELRSQLDETFSFAAHQKLLNQLSGDIDLGIEQLQEEQQARRKCDERLEQLEKGRSERDKKEREYRQYEEQLIGIRNEQLEKLYSWAGNNQELLLPENQLQKIAVQIEQFNAQSDYNDLREPVREVWDVLRSEHLTEKIKVQQAADILEQQAKAKEAEITEWENQKDPEPDRTEAVKRNREKLQELGIEYYEFYKTVDFSKDVSPEQADRLEEALLQMGILDALIVSAQDRKRILSLDKGMADTYIFSDTAKVQDSLVSLLDVDNEQNNIIFYQQISDALAAVGYAGKEGGTVIYPDGSYQIGALTGTVTREYQARYIGVKARQKYREEKITLLTRELNDIRKEWNAAREQVQELEKRMHFLEEEWERFPSGDDLKVAVKSLDEVQEQIRRIVEEITRQEAFYREEQQQWSKIQEAVRVTSSKVYLPARLEVFYDARKEVKAYGALLVDLQIAHTRYLEGTHAVLDYREQMEDLEWDLEELIRQQQIVEKRIRGLEQSLDSVRGQLALTDYEAIRERLDHCIERLRLIPAERDASTTLMVKLEGQIARAKEEREKAAEEILHLRRKVQILERGLLKEGDLGYLDENSEKELPAEELARMVLRSSGETFRTKSREDFTGSLQEAYHQNRGYLPEYYLTMENIFQEQESEEFPEIRMRRLQIMAKYKGVAVSFKVLMKRIKEDIEIQSNLLNDQDRELFEDILANTISKKIRAKIYNSEAWVENMNRLMNGMETSSGLTLSLRWKSKRAEHEDQLDTRQLVTLLKKDVQLLNEDEFSKFSAHFRSKIQEARKLLEQTDTVKSFHMIMREVLDYRKWFEFQLESQKIGEKKKELTDRVFFTFSGGEKAMAMYVPLFSAVVAKYQGASKDAPRLISLDEAFAGVDETNIKDMFRLMVEFRFSFIINSQILWGDYETVPQLVIYQLLRPENAKFVTVISYIWNGRSRELVEDVQKVGEVSEGSQ